MPKVKTLYAEAYYKQYSGLQEKYISQYLRSTDFDRHFRPENFYPPPGEPVPPEHSYFLTGSGQTLGIDIFASLKTKVYINWLSYTLSKSMQQFDAINGGDEIPSLTDQRHQVSFSNLFTTGKWNFGAVVLFSKGRPYIASPMSHILPITREYRRLPNFFRTDLSANYNFFIQSLRVKTGISVINLFNRQNYFDVNTRTFNFDNTTFSETNLIQSQRLSLNVFLHISF